MKPHTQNDLTVTRKSSSSCCFSPLYLLFPSCLCMLMKQSHLRYSSKCSVPSPHIEMERITRRHGRGCSVVILDVLSAKDLVVNGPMCYTGYKGLSLKSNVVNLVRQQQFTRCCKILYATIGNLRLVLLTVRPLPASPALRCVLFFHSTARSAREATESATLPVGQLRFAEKTRLI